MNDKDKTKAELIKELKTLRKERKKEVSKNITKHKQVEVDTLAAKTRLMEIFESITDGFVAFDKEMNYTFLNTRGAELLGCKPADLLGKNYWTEFPEAKGTPFANAYLRALETRTPIVFEDYYEPWDRWFENRIYPTPEGIAIYFTETTERKKAEEKIRHLNLVLSAIRNVNQLIVKEKNRERLLKGTCNNLIETRGYYSAWIVLLDESGKLETYAEAGIAKEFSPVVEIFKKGESIVCSRKALKQQEVVTIKDPASTCPECPLAKKYSDRRAMTIRLEYNGKVYGFMSVSIPTYLTVDQEEQSLFEEVAGDVAFGLYNIKLDEELQQSYQRLKKTMNATIDTMSNIIEAKDPYTSGHQHRVCQLAISLARELGLSEDKIEGIRIASLIHDIGKIGLPTEILSKPNKLSDIEFSLIKGHSQIGYDILKSIDFSYPIAQIVLQHHERLDGSGYPNKLKGDKISLEAEIIGVADVVEAMSSFRPYRPALGVDRALEEISKNKGILYDPEVTDSCLKLFKEKGFKFKD